MFDQIRGLLFGNGELTDDRVDCPCCEGAGRVMYVPLIYTVQPVTHHCQYCAGTGRVDRSEAVVNGRRFE